MLPLKFDESAPFGLFTEAPSEHRSGFHHPARERPATRRPQANLMNRIIIPLCASYGESARGLPSNAENDKPDVRSAVVPPRRGPLAQGAPGNPLLRDEAIPHPAHRLDEGGMLTEFLTQREDVHVDRSAATCEVPSPHVLQQRIAGKGDAGVFHEMKEQVELARCER